MFYLLRLLLILFASVPSIPKGDIPEPPARKFVYLDISVNSWSEGDDYWIIYGVAYKNSNYAILEDNYIVSDEFGKKVIANRHPGCYGVVVSGWLDTTIPDYAQLVDPIIRTKIMKCDLPGYKGEE